jgi:hypothetical protein
MERVDLPPRERKTATCGRIPEGKHQREFVCYRTIQNRNVEGEPT